MTKDEKIDEIKELHEKLEKVIASFDDEKVIDGYLEALLRTVLQLKLLQGLMELNDEFK